MAINTTNLTTPNNFYEVAVAVNQLNGELIGILLVVGVLSISFLVLASKNNFTSSATASMTFATIVGILLAVAQLSSWFYVVMMVVITGGLIAIVLTKSK